MRCRSEERTIPQTTLARAQQSYRHEAFLWHGPEDYTNRLTGFIGDALEADEPILVAVTAEHRDWLRDGLGDRADDVEFVDTTTLHGNPARLMQRWQAFLDAHPGRPLRGVGESIWPGRRSAEVTECQLLEALLNVIVDPRIPLWQICPYDADGLRPAIVEEAHRSHPVIGEAEQYHGTPSYTGRAHVDTVLAADLPAPPTQPIVTAATAANIDRLETYVRLECYVAGLPAATAAQLAEATSQLAHAGLQRGAAEVTVRIWNQPEAVACEVSDPTVIADPLHGRLPPRRGEDGGAWFANQLCDLVQLRSTPLGTTVRAYVWR